MSSTVTQKEGSLGSACGAGLQPVQRRALGENRPIPTQPASTRAASVIWPGPFLLSRPSRYPALGFCRQPWGPRWLCPAGAGDPWWPPDSRAQGNGCFTRSCIPGSEVGRRGRHLRNSRAAGLLKLQRSRWSNAGTLNCLMWDPTAGLNSPGVSHEHQYLGLILLES
ncbi:uncharacterized protein [Marmota flaviventris]|uniref:uncharacterized protein isoform X2 n=1 Tax=Marmota flaviventris TaxID=93162 RepID=UPI003A8C3EDB